MAVSSRAVKLDAAMNGPDGRGDLRPRAAARDSAAARLRRVTQGSVLGTVTLGGIFAVLAAGSTHVRQHTSARAPSRAAPAALRAAPAPRIVPARRRGP